MVVPHPPEIVPPWYETVYRAFPGGWGYVFHRPPHELPSGWEDYLHLVTLTVFMGWAAWIISRHFA